MGTFFVVATPIGNLGDLSTRAVETLRHCDLIVAEDTRHTGQLLHRLGINARMISFNEHNVSHRIESIMAALDDMMGIAWGNDSTAPRHSGLLPSVRPVSLSGLRLNHSAKN